MGCPSTRVPRGGDCPIVGAPRGMRVSCGRGKGAMYVASKGVAIALSIIAKGIACASRGKRALLGRGIRNAGFVPHGSMGHSAFAIDRTFDLRPRRTVCKLKRHRDKTVGRHGRRVRLSGNGAGVYVPCFASRGKCNIC